MHFVRIKLDGMINDKFVFALYMKCNFSDNLTNEGQEKNIHLSYITDEYFSSYCYLS